MVVAATPDFALACSCAPAEALVESPELLAKFYERPELVVLHARVTELIDERHARVHVIEALRGPTTSEIGFVTEAPCGTQLRVGEERVFFVYAGWVNLCTKFEPRSQFIELLRGKK